MAKKADSIKSSFSLENLKKANQNFSDEKKKKDEKENTKKPYAIQFGVPNSLMNDFKNLYYQFLYATKNELPSHQFFRIVLLDIIKSEKLNKEKNIDQNILKIINRRGRRYTTSNFRSVDAEDMTKLFLGKYTDDTNDLYDLVMSFYSKKHMNYITSFTRGFFFYDVIEYLSNNINNLIKKYNKDERKTN